MTTATLDNRLIDNQAPRTVADVTPRRRRRSKRLRKLRREISGHGDRRNRPTALRPDPFRSRQLQTRPIPDRPETFRALDQLSFAALSKSHDERPATGHKFREISITLGLYRWKGEPAMKSPESFIEELA